MTSTKPQGDLPELLASFNVHVEPGAKDDELVIVTYGTFKKIAAALRAPGDGEGADERAAFEAWRRRTANNANKDDAIAREGFGDDASYSDRTTRAMWIGWKGRAAIASQASATGDKP